MSSIVLPHGFQYVVAAVAFTPWVLMGQTFVVVRHRQIAGIKYPQLYADKAQVEASKDAHIFNCAQRAHQNTLETLPIVVISTLISGLKYPIPAAAMCAAWAFGRFIYTRGYVTGDPAKRGPGSIFANIMMTLLLLGSTYVSLQPILAGLKA